MNRIFTLTAAFALLGLSAAHADSSFHWRFTAPGGTNVGDNVVSDTDSISGLVATAQAQAGHFVTYANAEPTSGGTTAIQLNNSGTSNSDGAYLQVADDPALTGHANGETGFRSLRLEAWINPAEFKLGQIVRKTDSNGNGYMIYMQNTGAVGIYVQGPGGATTLITERVITDLNTWHHVVGTWDSSIVGDNMTISLDGHTSSTHTGVYAMSDTTNPLGIGTIIRAIGNTGQFFNGLIDEVKIIGTSSTTPIDPPDPTVLESIGYWSMDLEPGKSVGDPIESITEPFVVADATAVPQTTRTLEFSAPSPAVGSDAAADFANAGTSNNDGAYLFVEPSNLINGHYGLGTGYSAMELDVWIRPRELKLGQIVRYTNGSLGDGFQLYLQANGKIGFRLENSGTIASLNSTNTVNVDEWVHIVARWDHALFGTSNNITLNVGGTITEASTGLAALANVTGPLVIGGLYRAAGNTGQFFNGEIDEVIFKAGPAQPTAVSPAIWTLY